MLIYIRKDVVMVEIEGRLPVSTANYVDALRNFHI
jgi:hypothetical protein